MAFYIAAIVHSLFYPIAVAVLWPLLSGPDGTRARAIGLGAGILLGLSAVFALSFRVNETMVLTVAEAVGFALSILGFAILLPALAARPGEGGRTPLLRLRAVLAPVLIAGLTFEGVVSLWSATVNRAFSATDVINTDLIVNSAAVVLGLALLLAILPLLRHVAALVPGRAPGAVLLALLAVAIVGGSGQTVLGLLRLEWIAVTPGRITFAAKLSLFDPWMVYAQIALCLILVPLAFLHRFRLSGAGHPVARRLELARVLVEARWRNGFLACLALIAFSVSYQDFYASRPPSLSPAAPAAPDAKGEVRIPIEAVKDGKLHRYAFISSAGHKVRFFLINRYDPAHVDIGVVFDACMICGDAGYVENGDEIICIACNVRMYRPSIGKPGGCNPIPLAFTRDGDTIVIGEDSLEKGARYFGEVVEITVIDPVSGAKITNTKAPFQHEAEGRTYFFAAKDSYERFRADPKAYLKGPSPAGTGE